MQFPCNNASTIGLWDLLVSFKHMDAAIAVAPFATPPWYRKRVFSTTCHGIAMPHSIATLAIHRVSGRAIRACLT